MNFVLEVLPRRSHFDGLQRSIFFFFLCFLIIIVSLGGTKARNKRKKDNFDPIPKSIAVQCLLNFRMQCICTIRFNKCSNLSKNQQNLTECSNLCSEKLPARIMSCQRTIRECFQKQCKESRNIQMKQKFTNVKSNSRKYFSMKNYQCVSRSN